MHLPPLDSALLLTQALLQVGLCLQLWRYGLYRVYINFFLFLIFAFLQSLVPVITYGTVAYGYMYMATETVVVCFYALIVLECYGRVLRELAGIARLSRRYIRFTLGAAIVGALLLLGLERTPKTPIQFFYALDRTVVSSLMLFVLLMMVFLVYYPIPLSRNVIIYSAGYVVYFLSKASALFLRNVSPQWQPQVSTFLIGVSIVCLVVWLAGLNRRGEQKTMVIGHQWRPEDEERLLLQLKAINASLSRSARK